MAVLFIGAETGALYIGTEIDDKEIENTSIEWEDIEVVETENLVEETTEEESVAVEEGITEEEYKLIARVVTAEAKGEPKVGQIAVAVTILNRADCKEMTIHDVVFEEDQYAIADSYREDVYETVKEIESYRLLFPSNMVYFRTEKYHKIGEPYTTIGNHFFSIEPRYGGEEL